MSGHQRTVKLPPCTTKPRSSIDSSLHGAVDSALRILRSHSRRLIEAASQLAVECRILERLYYKGLNQHRNALFWRNISEVRRYSRRVCDVKLGSMVEELRYSFFVENTQNTIGVAKQLKGSWAFVPETSFLASTVERLNGVEVLLAAASAVAQKAFRALNLLMQTGAFLQLSLTLTAVVSRIGMLFPEMKVVTTELLRALVPLLAALRTGKICTQSTLYTKEQSAPNIVRPSVTKFATASGVSEDPFLKDHVDEDDLGIPIKPSDLGLKVDSEETQVPKIVEAAPVNQPANADLGLSIFRPQSSFSQSFTPQSRESSIPTSKLQNFPADKGPHSDSIQNKKRKNDQSRDSSNPVRKNKIRKGKRDEIDDIFGSL